jgi:hyaluronoglucosaminidase
VLGRLAATAALTASLTSAQAVAGSGLPAIYPVPKSLRAGSGTTFVTPAVTLLAGPLADQPTLKLVRSILSSAGARTFRTAAAPGSLTVSVGPGGAQGLPAGGYVLKIGGNRVALDGVDASGTFYAAQTLRRLVHGSRLPAVTIRDWPSLGVRGVVEGFYGAPWPDNERLAMLDFFAAHKLNSYIYSPKDDPYLRLRWRDRYPAARLRVLRALVARAADDHVTFTYALSPGNSICFSSTADLDALIAKLQSVWAIGVRSFAIPLDDIDYSRWHCSMDEARFGSGGAAAATGQAYLLNRVDALFIAKHRGAAPLITVPTEYGAVGPTPYTAALAAKLSRDVVVQWTGGAVFVRTLTRSRSEAARRVYGHPILVWDNYPVNDEKIPRVLRLGPYRGRDPGLDSVLVGIAANPMVQAEASRIPLFTFADYAWNTAAYDPDRSWAASLAELAGGDPTVTAALGAFADVNYASVLDQRGAPALGARIAAFWKAWKAGSSAGVAPLHAALAALRDAPALLRVRLHDPAFLEETSPWLDAARTWARADLAALDMLVASRAGRQARVDADRRSIPYLVTLAKAFSDLEEGHSYPVQVGGGVVNTFVTDALAAVK